MRISPQHIPSQSPTVRGARQLLPDSKHFAVEVNLSGRGHSPLPDLAYVETDNGPPPVCQQDRIGGPTFRSGWAATSGVEVVPCIGTSNLDRRGLSEQ